MYSVTFLPYAKLNAINFTIVSAIFTMDYMACQGEFNAFLNFYLIDSISIGDTNPYK